MSSSRRLAFLALLGAVLLISCGTQPSKPTVVEASKPAEKKEVTLYTARPCLERMSYMALKWQPDALPYRLESEINTESNGQEGRSSVWRATFASANRRVSRTYMCSGSLLKESPAFGVTANREFPYPAGTTILTFSLPDMMTDSDAASKVAHEHGGANILKQNPKQPVLYHLGVDTKTNKLLWAAIYGTSEKDRKGIGIIDAKTSKFLSGAK